MRLGRFQADWPRRVLALALASGMLFVSGCVYLRLLALKNQLETFDKNFTLDTSNGLKISCLNPILLPHDFRWLGITPASTKRLGRSEQWHIRWAKEVPAGSRETSPYSVEIDLFFTENKLTRVVIPERYFAFMSKPFLVGLLRGMGRAEINQLKRSADVNFSNANQDILSGRIMAGSLEDLLGSPTERRLEGERTLLRYLFTPTPVGEKSAVFDLLFTFETASGHLRRIDGRSPVGKMSFRFDGAASL